MNVGCVPKKIMWFAAHHRELLHGPTATAQGYGITGVGDVGFDWEAMKAQRDAEVTRLNGIYERGWKKAGCDVVVGYASVHSPHEVKVVMTADGSEKIISARCVIE